MSEDDEIYGAWPFWAPSDEARIEAAFELAELRPGERFLDLGCGDGSVLVSAARRGASVVGVEVDDELAAEAAGNLESAGVDGEVVVADFEDECHRPALTADVVFTYLSPATLQRLTPALSRLPAGTRLVTAGYALTGWEADAESETERCWLYRLPLRPAPSGTRPGWDAPAVLAGVPADATSLLAVRLRHPGGPVAVRPKSELASMVQTRAGVDEAGVGEEVVVDLRWEPAAAGAWVSGQLACPPLEPLVVHAIWTEGDTGIWGVTPDGARRIENRLRHGRDPEAILDAARSRPSID